MSEDPRYNFELNFSRSEGYPPQGPAGMPAAMVLCHDMKSPVQVRVSVEMTEAEFRRKFPKLEPAQHIYHETQDPDGYTIRVYAADAMESNPSFQEEAIKALAKGEGMPLSARNRLLPLGYSELTLHTIQALLELYDHQNPDRSFNRNEAQQLLDQKGIGLKELSRNQRQATHGETASSQQKA